MSEETPNRRAVLATIGAGMAGATVLARDGSGALDPAETPQTANAAVRKTELAQAALDDRATRRELVTTHAESVVSRLREESILPGGTEAFDLDTFDPERTGLSRASDWEGTAAVTASQDGEEVTLFMTATNTDDRRIMLFVKPERDESYAIVRNRDSGMERLFRSDGTVGVDPANAEASISCESYSYCGTTCIGCSNGLEYQFNNYVSCYVCSSGDSSFCCCATTNSQCGCSTTCDDFQTPTLTDTISGPTVRDEPQ